MRVYKNMIYLLGYLFSTVVSFVEEKPLIDTNFLESLNSYEDNEKLDNAVRELKESVSHKSKEISLSNGDTKKIVIL